MWSVTVEPGDGRISNPKAAEVGDLHACFGSTTDPKVVSFYTEGRIAGVPLSGNGNCVRDLTDFPEKGISVVRCFLNIGGLPAGYTGGTVSTNTIGTRSLIGVESDPPGYVQPSIATIRLWKTR